MERVESRKLLDKHLELLGQKPIRYNRKIYQAFLNALNEAINYTPCCEEFANGKCKPMVNADWTYLRCECGKRFEPKG